MMETDRIFDMLSWNGDAQTQAKGREAAKTIEDIRLLMQPQTATHGKDIWENCALVLAEKTDEALRPHFETLLSWLRDANWPGYDIIFERLQCLFDEEMRYIYLKHLQNAIEEKDFGFILSLNAFYGECRAYQALHTLHGNNTEK